ncbi:MAG: hypothetical protein AB1634_06980 [Thermodesulfobacteriota bacterium]
MKRWQLTLVLLAAFLAGAASGAAGIGLVVQARFRAAVAGGSVFPRQLIMSRLTSRLDLDSATQARIAPILDEASAEVGRLRQENAPRLAAIIDRAVARMQEELSPAQAETLAEMVARLRPRLAPGQTRGP